MGVRRFTFVCLHVSVGLCKNTERKLGPMTEQHLAARHIKGTVLDKGLSFTLLLVPNTTTLTTRQLHTEWLCCTDIGRTSLQLNHLLLSLASPHHLILSPFPLFLLPAALLLVIITVNEVCERPAPKTIFFSINSTNETVIK